MIDRYYVETVGIPMIGGPFDGDIVDVILQNSVPPLFVLVEWPQYHTPFMLSDPPAIWRCRYAAGHRIIDNQIIWRYKYITQEPMNNSL